jgi:hypothetical protein
VSALVAVGSAVFTAFVILPLIRWRMNQQDKQEAEKEAAAVEAGKNA